MFTLYAGLISGILSAIIAPKLGALSDRYGRKKIMLITTSGMLIGEVITIVVANFPETFPVNFILLGYIFDGLCGSFIASMALSHSYATDCTPPNKRNVVFGYFHGCLFTGIAIGPLFAGYVVKLTGKVVSMFYIALGCHIFFLLFLLLIIPESLSKARQYAAREKYRLDMEAMEPSAEWIKQARSFNLFAPLKVLYPTGPGSSPAVRWNLLFLATIDTIIFGVAMGAISVVILYLNYEFQWDTYYQSIFVSVVNVCRVFTLVIILPGLTHIFRGKSTTSSDSQRQHEGTDRFELTIIRVAILFDILGFLGYSLSRKGELFMFSGTIASIGGMGSPTLQAALTKHVYPDQVGQLLGAMGLLHAFAKVVSPTIFNSIYAATVGKFTQTVFVILTIMFGIAEAITWFVKPGGKSCLVKTF
jgi:MFS family permease